ncbi:MAG: dihydrolipoamide dehydrogenase [Alphaproteobacteria bacterium]|nr:MAG: dihydrolipoamide dehydrogenase [Alphaproteobacteria bacterium]
MTRPLTPDLCVIGAGSGGLSVAAVAAQLDLDVVLVEKGEMGGDCLNYGCVPSKSLIAAAKRAAQARSSGPFGITAKDPKVDFLRVHHHIHDVIATIAPHDSVERFEGLGVTVIRDHARFTGPREVVAGGVTIRARRFVIAAGSRPAVPPIRGLEQTPYLTNETIFDLTALPEHLLVVGGGPIGLEMAQAFRRLGSRVTVATLAFLEKDDPEMAGVVLDTLRREGVDLIDRATVERVEPRTGGVAVSVKDADGKVRRIEGSHLLLAIGRTPNVNDLGLDAANVAFDQRGIKVDRRLRTSNRRIYAIGDVTGRFQFTHCAEYDAGIVIRNAVFRLPARARDNAIPWVTFTDPELAHVGLTEAMARDLGHRDLRVLRWSFADNDRARADRTTEGLIKVIATRRGKVLGATIVGHQAGELIHPWVIAIESRLKLSALARYIAPYPTRGEVTKRVAGAFYTPTLFSARTKWLVRLLSRLG